MPLNLLSVKYRKKKGALKILLYKVSNIEPSCSRWRHDELSTHTTRDFSFLVRFNLALVIG